MKTYAVADSTVATRNAIRKRTLRALGKSKRDCITLSDPTDCLLEAYDCVARRAYEHFLARGPRPGGELADWLRAERELLLGFTINVQDSAEFVYALASIPGATAARLEVGIESRWLVILAQDSRPAQVVRDEVVSGVTRSFDLGLAIGRGKSPAAGAGAPRGVQPGRRAHPVEIRVHPRIARRCGRRSLNRDSLRWPPGHPHAEIHVSTVNRTAVGFVGARYIVPGKHAWQCRTIRADVALRP